MYAAIEALRLMLESSPAAWIATIFVLGLFVGSFLNVVIHRLPIMLQRGWTAEAKAILAEQATAKGGLQESEPPAPRDRANAAERGDARESPQPAYNLIVPRSACPKCGAMITAAQNIPVVSYLLLKGRCAKCGAPI